MALSATQQAAPLVELHNLVASRVTVFLVLELMKRTAPPFLRPKNETRNDGFAYAAGCVTTNWGSRALKRVICNKGSHSSIFETELFIIRRRLCCTQWWYKSIANHFWDWLLPINFSRVHISLWLPQVLCKNAWSPSTKFTGHDVVQASPCRIRESYSAHCL